MKRIWLIVLSTMAGANLALAQGLEEQAERETNWRTLSASFPGFTGSTRFAVTESGKLRLIELSSLYRTDLKVGGNEGIFKSRYKAQWKRQCAGLRGALEYELENKNRYSFDVLVNPLNAAKSREVETNVHEVRVEPALSFVNGAVPLTSPSRLKAVQTALTQLFQAERENIARDGRFKVEMSGVDDVVCDLLMGQVRFDVGLVANFDAAYLRRHEVLSARELIEMQERLKAMSVPKGTGTTVLLARAAHLGVLLEQKFGKDYEAFVLNKFGKLHESVISVIDASVVGLNAEAANRVARRLDDLSIGRDTNQTVISLNPVNN